MEIELLVTRYYMEGTWVIPCLSPPSYKYAIGDIVQQDDGQYLFTAKPRTELNISQVVGLAELMEKLSEDD